MSGSIWVHLHVLAALLSLLGFITRGVWMLGESPMLAKKPVKILPHVIDTVLLVTALLAAYSIYWTYGVNPDFITAKIVALLVYIGLGLVALKLGKTKGMRASAWILAIVVFIYIAAMGASKSVIFA